MPKASLARLVPRRVEGFVLCVIEGRVCGLFWGVSWKNREALAIEREGRGGEVLK